MSICRTLIVFGLNLVCAVRFRAIGLVWLNGHFYLCGPCRLARRDGSGSVAWVLIIVAGRTRVVRERLDRRRGLAGVAAC